MPFVWRAPTAAHSLPIIWFVPFRWVCWKSAISICSSRIYRPKKSTASMVCRSERWTKYIWNSMCHSGPMDGKDLVCCGRRTQGKRFERIVTVDGSKMSSAFIQWTISRTFCADGFPDHRPVKWNWRQSKMLRLALLNCCEYFWSIGMYPNRRNWSGNFIVGSLHGIQFDWNKPMISGLDGLPTRISAARTHFIRWQAMRWVHAPQHWPNQLRKLAAAGQSFNLVAKQLTSTTIRLFTVPLKVDGAKRNVSLISIASSHNCKFRLLSLPLERIQRKNGEP